MVDCVSVRSADIGEEMTVASPQRLERLAPELMVSLRDHVHRALRMAILSGNYAPEELLNERHLAAQLGVSTTPVKEALRRLEAEGLVVTRPRRGVVSLFSQSWAEEMILARAALESMIARQAASRITPAGVATLQATVASMRRATDEANSADLVELNETLHEQIHQISQCDYLGRLIERQRLYDDGIRRVIHSDPTERAKAFQEHSTIAALICEGNSDAAEKAMRDHVLRSGERYLELVFASSRPTGER